MAQVGGHHTLSFWIGTDHQPPHERIWLTCKHAVRDLENFCFFDAGSPSASSDCPIEFSTDLGIGSVPAEVVVSMPLFPRAVCEVR